jgi:hypothetical protein
LFEEVGYGVVGLDESAGVRDMYEMELGLMVAYCRQSEGTLVVDRAREMIDAMAEKLWDDSRPPFRMAALPDLIARAEMFAITSGRASNIMRRTPIGQVIRERIRLSSRRVFDVILLTLTC